ncbi:hypothetical protein ABB37_08804 [Leptomonas pyrrhocoris]|uniref:Uncharacterized protein n=1 Tax=Leptomonas pyrrhocoris TaxID=157538 RepID=A0A0M9FSF3_LEPPY|nr:hypothetical protein ABB37_08804 [Leptomonas pyrrhocoris]XP_015653580.1 hypothetical protein ABB37_08804 [Leptomonas pyrrhocoris]KPA75140.1 hypothetical protein ABB37_08804 [Leptomonas pyrrhocoris]KPA75141.1 hypothetical protein ABB37_08804 [Leptomonas pyrrhocoris]|eukprot:XP_015653579.1 hypothetical protein ABB37_08804 [Leptomonas pyrrhocoris]
MLKRHGTRLDIGTAEDVEELNAAEALLRASYKPTSMSTGGSSTDFAGFNPRSAAPYYMPGATVRSAAAGISGGGSGGGGGYYSTTGVYGGVAQGGNGATNYTAEATAAVAAAALPPPHVYLGHSAGGADGRDTRSPSGRASAGTIVTGYASSSGRTPVGEAMTTSAPAGVRGTAPPPSRSGGGGGESGGDEEEVVPRGRPSMRRAPFAIPVPAAASMQLPYAPTSVPSRRGGPSTPPLPPPPRYGGEDNEEEVVDEEEAPARPSRVSGRY